MVRGRGTLPLSASAVVVDDGAGADWGSANLFGASASPERKYLGFMILVHAIQNAPLHRIPDIFSSSTIRCLVTHTADVEKYLHRAALKCLKEIQAKVDRNPDTADKFILGLAHEAAPDFDRLTKTKTIANLLSTASGAALGRVVEGLSSFVRRTHLPDEKATDDYRRAVAELFGTLYRVRGLKAVDLGLNCLDHMAQVAYTSPVEDDDRPEPAYSPSTRKAFQTRLSTSYAQALSDPSALKMVWPYETLNRLRRHLQGGKLTMVLISNVEIDEIMAFYWRRMKRLEKKVGLPPTDFFPPEWPSFFFGFFFPSPSSSSAVDCSSSSPHEPHHLADGSTDGHKDQESGRQKRDDAKRLWLALFLGHL